MTDYKQLCAELVEDLESAAYDIGLINEERDSLIERARAALAAPEPEGPTDEEARELADDLGMTRGFFDHECGLHISCADLQGFANAVLARWGRPAPEPPGDGEVAELAAKLRRLAPQNPLGTADPIITRAADLLEQRHPAPVPVSERLKQMEDLAADDVSALRYIEQFHGRLYGVGWDRVYEKADHLKPSHGVPAPLDGQASTSEG